jgi:signal peptidase II
VKKVVTAALVCLILDQLSKLWIVTHLSPYASVPIYGDFARLVLTYNPGLIFGAFQNNPFLVNFVVIAASIILVIYTFTELKRNGHTLSLIAVGMIFGGALGNTIDRVRFGKVVDFIAIGNFPVFNLADSSIVTGISLLILSYWVEGRSAKKVLTQSVGEGTMSAACGPPDASDSLSERSVGQNVTEQVLEGHIEDADDETGDDANENDEGAGNGKAENLASGQVG